MRSAAERMLAAIGEPEIVDTSHDQRLGRIFMNRTIRVYPTFADFYGMEETIERIVGYFRHAAQGLEERKQVLYLLGPVGGGKSSLAERLKLLMEKLPIYTLKAGKEISPVFESPLGLFDPIRMGDTIERNYRIPKRRLTGLASPWALKRLDEFGGDVTKFTVVRVPPLAAPPDLRRQDRAGRREQPGHLARSSARSTSGSSSSSARPMPTPMPSRAASIARPRAFSNSSRCSRRRSRCCIRC